MATTTRSRVQPDLPRLFLQFLVSLEHRVTCIKFILYPMPWVRWILRLITYPLLRVRVWWWRFRLITYPLLRVRLWRIRCLQLPELLERSVVKGLTGGMREYRFDDPQQWVGGVSPSLQMLECCPSYVVSGLAQEFELLIHASHL